MRRLARPRWAKNASKAAQNGGVLAQFFSQQTGDQIARQIVRSGATRPPVTIINSARPRTLPNSLLDGRARIWNRRLAGDRITGIRQLLSQPL